MILRDTVCRSCGRESEQLEAGGKLDPCDAVVGVMCWCPDHPQKILRCGGQLETLFTYRPTSGVDIKIWDVLSKASVLKQKWQGRLPYRKSSESQTD